MHLHVSAEEKKVTSDADKTYQKRKRAVRFVCNHIPLKFQVWNQDLDTVVQIWTFWKTVTKFERFDSLLWFQLKYQ